MAEYHFGEPLTEEERMARHLERYGTPTVPPRGTGRLQSNPDSTQLFWLLILLHLGLIGLEAYIAWKQGWIKW